ncbi:MAG: hypothetical protein HKN58_05300 [Xanthomonadales bacterium]|nr:hypothetical protein [Xanthomonadales bacterium]
MKTIIFAPLFLLFSIAAHAETTKLSAFDTFEQQKATILEDIKSDTVYREISHQDANIVRDALDRMSAYLSDVEDLSEMTENQRATLFNEQELVNTILTMAENDSRTVCRRRGRLGTNFKTTTCETVAERRERQEADRMAIDQMIRGRPITSN